MVVATPEKMKVYLKLRNGYSADGSVNTISINMGSMSLSNFDVNKAFAIAALLEPCLDRAIYRIEKVETSTIENW